ncbi:MAG: acyl dehydratase [SAR202 cluster bacterium]|nr:acyl dehydratase [SAR202 cluster bacterium]
MNEGDSLPTIEKLITQAQIQKYAEASGDFNPVHIDMEFAKTTQFGGTIAHGMMIAAGVSEMMSVAFAKSWLENGRLKLRFKAPVRPGDSIATFGTVKGVKVKVTEGARELTCAVGIRKQDGEEVITGDAVVTLPQGR